MDGAPNWKKTLSEAESQGFGIIIFENVIFVSKRNFLVKIVWDNM